MELCSWSLRDKCICSCGLDAQVDGYEHFRSGNCVLFEVADIQNWELDWNRQVERRWAPPAKLFEVGGCASLACMCSGFKCKSHSYGQSAGAGRKQQLRMQGQ